MNENKTQLIVLAAVAVVAIIAIVSVPNATMTGHSTSFRNTIYTIDRCQELFTSKAAVFSFNRMEVKTERALWTTFGCRGENVRQRQPNYLCYAYIYENGQAREEFYTAQCGASESEGVLTTTISEAEAQQIDPSAYQETANRQITIPANSPR